MPSYGQRQRDASHAAKARVACVLGHAASMRRLTSLHPAATARAGAWPVAGVDRRAVQKGVERPVSLPGRAPRQRPPGHRSHGRSHAPASRANVAPAWHRRGRRARWSPRPGGPARTPAANRHPGPGRGHRRPLAHRDPAPRARSGGHGIRRGWRRSPAGGAGDGARRGRSGTCRHDSRAAATTAGTRRDAVSRWPGRSRPRHHPAPARRRWACR